ncbi:MAG: hypothetical protein V1748_03375 [Actinomycetota bacterium]
MKKIAVSLAVVLLVLCLSIVVLYKSGAVTSQTTPQPGTSAPTTAAPVAAASSYANRAVGRWQTSNMVWLNTLIFDTNTCIEYLDDMNLAYAEETFPQLLCDIRTLQGRNPPDWSPAADISGDPPWVETVRPNGGRDLWAAPSGYKCTPIPDAQSAADLNLALAQLETAISHMISGINNSNGDLIRLGEAEIKQASATLGTVVTDLGNANK